MNIFYLDSDPVTIASWLNDRHIVKMVEESAQMLSTAHRLLDGTPTNISYEKGGKQHNKKFWLFPGESVHRDGKTWVTQKALCYQVAHPHHPSTIWTRTCDANYYWHRDLLVAMINEYWRRYGKTRRVTNFINFLGGKPSNIPSGQFTPPPQAMPDIYKGDDCVEAYRTFYAGQKWHFSKWTDREPPNWFFTKMQDAWTLDKTADRLTKVHSSIMAKTPRADRRVLQMAVELSREIY